MNVLSISQTLKYYKRQDIEDAILSFSEHREIGVRYGDNGFGKRPDVLNYKDDILALAQRRATSFHASEELWSNPLLLNSSLSREELDDLRIGWDLVFDIDCHFFDYSKLSAKLITEILKAHGVSSFSVKFSGNKGFHIGIPFEAFPSSLQGMPTKNLFPEAPRRIATYVKHLLKPRLAKEIMSLEKNNFDRIVKKVGKPREELIYYVYDKRLGEKRPLLNVDSFLEIDTILIASRHMFRMPYSLHEKSGLASIPVDPKRVLEFSKKDAVPESVIVNSKFKFLDRSRVSPGEASALIIQAFDFSPKSVERVEPVKKREFEVVSSPLSREYFAPCIKNILRGVDDGRKRSVFILINYLTSLGWNLDDILELLLSWNKNNKEPLRENYIVQQVNYRRNHNKRVLPPNCGNSSYYKDIGVCSPDSLCSKIKNPVNYSILKMRSANRTSRRKKSRRKAGRKESVENDKNSGGAENKN